MADGTTELTTQAAQDLARSAGHGAEGAGMPQLDFSSFPHQIFWLAVALVVIYLVLSRVALPRIGAVLSERAGTITHDLTAAEDLKAKAAEAEAAYDKALADARSEAGRIADAAKAEVQAELDDEMAKADAEIAARTAESVTEIEAIRDEAKEASVTVARETAREIVAAFGTGGAAKAVDAAIDQRMKG